MVILLITCTITDLIKLPGPHNKIILQLSKFSLREALNNNKLVLPLMRSIQHDPGVASIEGAINGFGPLKAVQHFGITGKTIRFNFLHFTIQEFLAAHHVANLSPSDELKILKEKFWSDIHSKMFAIYITLTKGQRPSFKQFIKPSLGQRLNGFLTGAPVANRFCDDQVKSFVFFNAILKLVIRKSVDPLKMQKFSVAKKLFNLWNRWFT